MIVFLREDLLTDPKMLFIFSLLKKFGFMVLVRDEIFSGKAITIKSICRVKNGRGNFKIIEKKGKLMICCLEGSSVKDPWFLKDLYTKLSILLKERKMLNETKIFLATERFKKYLNKN
jgi:hypothetical protein